MISVIARVLSIYRRGMECFLNQSSIKNFKSFPIVCIGNKLDLDVDRKVLSEEVVETTWCQEFLKFYHFEVSAKDGRNVEEAFRQATMAALEYHYSTGEGPLLVPHSIYHSIRLETEGDTIGNQPE